MNPPGFYTAYFSPKSVGKPSRLFKFFLEERPETVGALRRKVDAAPGGERGGGGEKHALFFDESPVRGLDGGGDFAHDAGWV